MADRHDAGRRSVASLSHPRVAAPAGLYAASATSLGPFLNSDEVHHAVQDRATGLFAAGVCAGLEAARLGSTYATVEPFRAVGLSASGPWAGCEVAAEPCFATAATVRSPERGKLCDIIGRMPPWPTLLGLNLWLIGLVVPLLLGRGTISTGAWLLAVPAPVALLLGLRLRRFALGPGLLLLGVPLLTLLPVADGPLAAPRLHPRPATVLLLGVLVAYLISASSMLAARRWSEPGTPAWQEQTVATAEVSRRLLRRIATYRLLALVCVAVPALFLYAVALHPEHARALRQLVGTPARLGGLQASLLAAVTMVFCVVFRFAVMAPLAAHLGHDRALRSRIEALRTAGRRGRPRPQLYVAMVLALASMALLIWWSL